MMKETVAALARAIASELTEFALRVSLARHPGQVLTRELLLETGLAHLSVHRGTSASAASENAKLLHV
jgi:DNA-binding response OmpR family regulator